MGVGGCFAGISSLSNNTNTKQTLQNSPGKIVLGACGWNEHGAGQLCEYIATHLGMSALAFAVRDETLGLGKKQDIQK